jgi:hypothetical protein
MVSFRDQWEELKLGKAILLERRSTAGKNSKSRNHALPSLIFEENNRIA